MKKPARNIQKIYKYRKRNNLGVSMRMNLLLKNNKHLFNLWRLTRKNCWRMIQKNNRNRNNLLKP